MNNTILESGMEFVSDNAFYIEKSDLYTKLGDSVRSVEFIRVKGDKLLFVEAKTTFPDPNNPNVENKARFQSGIGEICEKFIHSLNLVSSVEVGVAGNTYKQNFILPDSVSIEFILVIKKHELKWCKQVKEKLTTTLPKHIIKIWRPVVHVINADNAKRWNLIIS